MAYRIVDVELGAAIDPVELDARENGVALVSRSAGYVVGFALHRLTPGAVLSSSEIRQLLDPRPAHPAIPGWQVRGQLDEPQEPSITVAICTKDRPESLARCLQSVNELPTLPTEVLVLDNGSSDDRTKTCAEDFGARYVEEPAPGLDVARNRALAEATSEIVAFIDDDVVLDRAWLSALRGTWRENPDAAAVSGQVLPAELDTDAQIAFERFGGFRSGNETVRYFGQWRADNALYPYGAGMFGAGCNMSFRRSFALELGGFDEALDTGAPLPGGGDLDMLHRVVRNDGVLVYDPRAVVFHRHRETESALVRQYESWGRAFMAFVAKTYRDDPPGRPRLRRLVLWWFRTQAVALRQARDVGEPGDARLVRAQLSGGVRGLFGEYGRSVRRQRRLRPREKRPVVGLLPWGDSIEDYLEPIGLDVEAFARRVDGGWLFGYVEALRRAGVDTVIICWSRRVVRPVRRIHEPSGAAMWVLPTPKTYRLARRFLADPYAWDRRSAIGSGPAWRRGAGLVARVAAPYLSTPPWLLLRTIRREHCDVILCQEYEEGRFDVAVGVGRMAGLPVYATFQGGDHTRTRLERWVRPHALRAAQGYIVGAEGEARRLGSRYGIPSPRVARIPNPLDVDGERSSSRLDARQALRIPPETRVAMWHGRVDIYSKGLDVLIDAWPLVVKKSAGPVLLLLIGTGVDAPALRQRLQELACAEIQWRDEYVLDRDLIQRYLRAADVYVCPSRHEGFPVAPIEALAAGLPVVASDASGLEEILGSGTTRPGVIVPINDPDALADALGSLLFDDALREQVAGGAVAQARRFSSDVVGRELRAFLFPDRPTGPDSSQPLAHGVH